MLKKKKNNKGFTLVELLVVIAIIGILAVVAVPALFKNIEKGKVADLESDISAIRSAVLSYYTDNSEYPIDNSAADSNATPQPAKQDAIVELKEDMSHITETGAGSNGKVHPDKKQATLDLLSELEGLSFPYGGSYKLTAANGTSVAKSPQVLYLTITTDGVNTTISEDGLKKLAQDLGLNKVTNTGNVNGTTTTMVITAASAPNAQKIIIPLINK